MRIRAWYYGNFITDKYVDFEYPDDLEFWETDDDTKPRRMKLKDRRKIYYIHSWVHINDKGEPV